MGRYTFAGRSRIVDGLWVMGSCTVLAAALWFVRLTLFVNGGPQSAENATGAAMERAASAGITGLWDEMHLRTKGPGQIADAGKTSNATQREAEPEDIEASSPEYPAEASAPSSLANIKVAFKIDRQRGRRKTAAWSQIVAFSRTQTEEPYIVEVMALGTDKNGEAISIDPDWTPVDPDMIAVSRSPEGGREVAIRVLRAGRSRLRVAFQGISNELTITASPADRGMRVQVSQQ